MDLTDRAENAVRMREIVAELQKGWAAEPPGSNSVAVLKS
jgi:hypothetical protein